jgi:glycosyltransferase involved in cell wall biosynthesis
MSSIIASLPRHRPSAGRDARPATAVGGRRRSTTAIIPTYNRAAFLRECIESLLTQTLPVDRVIIVDDGSDDDTPAIVRRYAGRADYVRLDNRGKSAALNAVLPDVRTSHLWIVDDDDIVMPDAHARLDAALRANPGAGIAYGAYLRFRRCPRGQVTVQDGGYWSDAPPSEFLTATMEDMFAHQSGMLVASSLVRRVGPFREDLVRSQDYDMLLRIAAVAGAARADGLVFMQRVHDGVRGTAADRICASRREDRWIASDRSIFAERLAVWPLSAYLPGQRRIEGPGDMRRALIQRAVVSARHKLWSGALSDLRHAARIAHAPLSGDERRILVRAGHSKYGCNELFSDKALQDALVAFGAGGPLAGDMLRTIACGVRWRAREAFAQGRIVEGARILACILRLWLSGYRAWSQPISRRASSSQPAPDLLA